MGGTFGIGVSLHSDSSGWIEFEQTNNLLQLRCGLIGQLGGVGFKLNGSLNTNKFFKFFGDCIGASIVIIVVVDGFWFIGALIE